MARNSLLSSDYWPNLAISRQDVEFLHNYLFENETPLTPQELVPVLITERIRAERADVEARHRSSGMTYIPRGSFEPGAELVFPALDWKSGRVETVRPGINPSAGGFDVITVEMEGGMERMFASRLAEHALNEAPAAADESEDLDVEAIAIAEGEELARKIEAPSNRMTVWCGSPDAGSRAHCWWM